MGHTEVYYMNSSLKLSDLNECPYCGHDEFMAVGKPSGQVIYRQKFNGTASQHNTRMYDKLKIEYTRTYCAKCGKYLGNQKTDECTIRVKEALKMRTLI